MPRTLLLVTVLLAAASAFPAEEVTTTAPASPDDSQPAAASPQIISIEGDIVQTVDTESSKSNKKRSQGSNTGNLLAPLIQTPDVTPETVSLSPQITDPPKKGNAVQGLLLNILQPKPIVDTIREEEKYGNQGDRFAIIGRGVVAGFEGFSNILNKVLDFPFETAKKVSRSATEALNNLGSRLIGL